MNGEKDHFWQEKILRENLEKGRRWASVSGDIRSVQSEEAGDRVVVS